MVLATCFGFTKPSSGHYLLREGMILAFISVNTMGSHNVRTH